MSCGHLLTVQCQVPASATLLVGLGGRGVVQALLAEVGSVIVSTEHCMTNKRRRALAARDRTN